MFVEVLGSKEEMKTLEEFSVKLSYSLDYEKYMLIRDRITEIIKRG